MSDNIPCVIKHHETNQRGLVTILARPISPRLFHHLGNILVSKAALHATGLKPEDVKVGDRVELEVMAYAFRVFKQKDKADDATDEEEANE